MTTANVDKERQCNDKRRQQTMTTNDEQQCSGSAAVALAVAAAAAGDGRTGQSKDRVWFYEFGAVNK